MTRHAAAAVALALASCGLPEPEPLTRVVGVSPEGEAVPVSTSVEIRFSAAVEGEPLLDGRRLVITEAAALQTAIDAVESDTGAAGVGVAVAATLEDGSCRVVLRPELPLRSFTGYALVLSSRARAADGRPILDPEGRHRTFVASFETGEPLGPPPVPVISEVRADAETPEAGGEYVEVANVGAGTLDLEGFRLAKQTATGGLISCTITAPLDDGLVPPGGVALVAGGVYDGRYALPPGVRVLACGATALLGGIANDRAPVLTLFDRIGSVVATLGAKGSEICPVALEMIDVAGVDEPGNLACTGGSPGVIP